MKSSKKSLNTKFGKKYQNAGTVTSVPFQFPELQSKSLEPTLISQPESFQQISLGDPSFNNATVTPTQQPVNQQPDYNSLFTIGLGLTSTALNRNQDQQNRREFNQSIQNRQSNPLYDYNYMYGRTTSGGTEYQPIVKAEMGAQINKRYNTPNPINNVEIEGGEFLQLPDMTSEMAYGPSHSNGGIQTSLPEGTRVYSNHLKPMGSKKTFAQIAKKYDNTDYDKTLNNQFAKQVDKDTAMLMKQKNQKILDKLFMDQQLMNGNSNGETMAKNGASINNAGFQALPPAVQQKILSNMEAGGFSLPNPLYMQDGAWYNSNQWDKAMGNQTPQSENWYNASQWDNAVTSPKPTSTQPSNANWYNESDWDKATQTPTNLNNLPSVTQNRITNPGLNVSAPNPRGLGYTMNLDMNSVTPTPQPSQVNQPVQSTQPVKSNKQSSKNISSNIPFNLSNNDKAMPTYTEDEVNLIRKYDPNFNPTLGTVPGMQKTVDGVYGSTKNVDLFNQNYDWYLPKFKEQYGREFNPKSKQDVGLAQKAYQDEMTNRFVKAGYTPEEAKAVLEDVGFVNQKGLPNTFDEKLGFYTATRKLFDVTPKENPTGETPKETPVETPKDKPKAPNFNPAQGKDSGKYYRQAFPIDQAIPGIMGLANSQEIFPYAIPEINPQYISPQTLNIQSQLQDIDNMGQASVRAGADPLSAYIAGIGGKEKAFQSKQNFDAQGRMQADQFNAQSQMQSDYTNAMMFDRTYNQLIAQARDAQTAEQQAAITSVLNNYAKYNQDENLKSLYLDNLQSAFEIGKDRPYSFTLDPNGRPTFNYSDSPAIPEIANTAVKKKTEAKPKKKTSK